MAGITQQWDQEFFRTYLPILIAELQQIDTLYDGYFQLHSDLHHKLSSMLIQQPYQFQIAMCSSIYHHIVANVEAMQLENKTKVGKLAVMIKQYKGCLFNLAHYYRDYEQRSLEIEARKAKLEKQYQTYLIESEEVANQVAHRHNCRYNRTQILLNLGQLSSNNRGVFLKEKINFLLMELMDVKLKEQKCVTEGNNIVKASLGKLNACIDKIVSNSKQTHEKQQKRASGDSQKFETFGRENIRQDKQIRSSRSENARVSQFHNESQQMRRRIEEAELNCQIEGYKKINDKKASKILEAAILAESKNESQYSDEKSQIQNSQHRYSVA